MHYYKPSRELTRTERIKRNKKKHCASGVKRKKEEKTQQDHGHGYEDESEKLNASTSGKDSNSSILKE